MKLNFAKRMSYIKASEIREILRELCEWKGVEIVEGEVCPDHIHLVVCLLRNFFQ